jgi:hypothetical protein
MDKTSLTLKGFHKLNHIIGVKYALMSNTSHDENPVWPCCCTKEHFEEDFRNTNTHSYIYTHFIQFKSTISR